MTTVAGLDLSLTSTGLARITWGAGRITAETWYRGDNGVTTLPYPKRHTAIVHMAADILAWAEPCELVVIEEMVPNPVSRSTGERSALWWRVYGRLVDHEVPVLIVHPGTLKKYATGNGGRSTDKAAMRAAGRVAWPAVQTKKFDEDDALWLASLGMHMVDGPVPFEITPFRAEVAGELRLPVGEAA